MKGLFPQYDHSSKVDHAEAWKTATFVFDTNVLLNLYRYQESTREELLNVISKLENRIWIPHHVALEFQRNRLSVIAGQGKRFSEIRRVIETSKLNLSRDIEKLRLKKRHALINPEPLVSGFEKLADDFLRELETLQEAQQTLTAPDPLKERIEDLFEGKVGPAFSDQEEVNSASKIAEERYKNKTPPGYKDEAKEKEEIDEFIYNGITYKKKFGDYFVWNQLLTHTANSELKNIIFITDDSKEDWWLQIDMEGPKTIGPRVELVDEAFRVGKLNTFLMYKPEGFLKQSQVYLKTNISEQTLNEVREISSANKNSFSLLDPAHPRSSLYNEVAKWILDTHPMLEESFQGYIDFIANNGSENHAYDVRFLEKLHSTVISKICQHAINTSESSNFTTTTIFLIPSQDIATSDIIKSFQKFEISRVPEHVYLAIGYFDESANPKLKLSTLSRLKDLVSYQF
ncbi:PIN-like domain-containing protein [Pseudomonas pharyngis]|uniref:PIN-like domain-containing protein n=1 Tax=Pseudomonas pharyngis TaxID=2892333 RepID=UPI001F401A62|nr:PIN domain-containing protein [Pseudomonas pharyngis]